MKTARPTLSLQIRGRLIAGFSAVCIILVAAVALTLVQVTSVSRDTDRVLNLRVPTASASASIASHVHASLASLRGWMITKNPTSKNQRVNVWLEIHELVETVDHLSAAWTNPQNVTNWKEFKTILAEFETAQKQVEDIVGTIDEQPATKILTIEAAPHAAVIIEKITAMIDEEALLPATVERKALLGMMADVRGTMGLSLANIRAFLLTGDDKFRETFVGVWVKNERRFGDLGASQRLFTPSQREAFAVLAERRALFAPLPLEMFEIRASDQWNMANFLLVSEAAPRAERLLTILGGPLQDDGSRFGGMVDNQRKLQDVDATKLREDIRALSMFERILLAVGLVVPTLIVLATARSIVPPINAMVGVMEKLAAGQLDVEVFGLDKKDEIGAMARSVQVFKESAHERVRLKEEQIEQEERAETDKRDAMQKLAAGFEASVLGIVDSLSSASTKMRESAETLSISANESSHRADAVAAASEEASSNVQTVASATEELSNSVSEIRRQVSQSAELAKKAVAESSEMNSEVEGLDGAVQKIGDVVSLINDIAAQTNLLALNATIEAARAGDAGKGFAVVASEVKSLASQTAKATEEIGAQIGRVQGATSSAVTVIEKIRERIDQIAEVTTTIMSSVQEQGGATDEIARNVQEASAGTQEVNSNICVVNEAAGQTGRSAGELLGSASELSSQSVTLRAEVVKFLDAVRAA